MTSCGSMSCSTFPWKPAPSARPPRDSGKTFCRTDSPCTSFPGRVFHPGRGLRLHPQGHRQAIRRHHPPARAQAKARTSESRPARTVLKNRKTGRPRCRFSHFSSPVFFGRWLASKGGKTANSGRHCQRTSNHNGRAMRFSPNVVVAIVKEHQITTARPRRFKLGLVVAIVKEHQITTHSHKCGGGSKWSPLSKNIKSQLDFHAPGRVAEWSPLSKNIKSQLAPPANDLESKVVAIVKEHQITTAARRGGFAARVVAIVKEHQITTPAGCESMRTKWSPLSKNIKSQHRR